ncbi:MAG TPA: hypothetical protein VMW25_04700 [Clostridia bacterium]|nr:hypothetical protein [Clostridia bacterium]
MANPERSTQVLVPNILGDPGSVVRGMRGIGRLVEKTGSDGAEVMPTPWLTIEVGSGLAVIEESGIIAGHLSPREKREPQVIWREIIEMVKPSNLRSSLVFAESTRSYQTLVKIQKELKEKTGRELPTVFYPTAPDCPWERNEEEAGKFSQVLFQPCPEVVELWGVRSVEDLLAEMRRRHYTGICYDTLHARLVPELSDWRRSLLYPDFLEKVKEIHISAGRIDIAQAEIDIMEELEGLFHPEKETELNWILWELYNHGWRGRVVIEVLYRALARRRGKRLLTSEQLREDYRAIIANVRGISIEGFYPPARKRKA